MILTIDIGNTNIVLGCIDGDKTLFVERLSTVRTKTELEYAIDIKNVLDIYHIHRDEIEGGIISSVVPQITTIVKLAVEKILKKNVLVVGAGIKTGLNIRIDNPAQLGSDLVVDSVAAIVEYPAPLLIFDLGTANTVCVIDKNKNYIGCLIEGAVENSVIGRGCTIKEGAVVKNCVIGADVVIGKGVHADKRGNSRSNP